MKTVKALKAQQGLSSLQRPKFSAGLLLEDEDLTAGVDYTRNMTRLLFRSFFGCGVICGLKVKATLTCNGSRVDIVIDSGIALDGDGNPIHLPKPQTVTFDNDCKPLPPQVWVTLCYLEKCCRPRDISCTTDEDSRVHTRLSDGFEIRLYEEYPGCLCACVPKDLRKQTGKSDGCCPEPVAELEAAATAAPEAQGDQPTDPERDQLLTDKCRCYLSHYDGECDCGCGCRCVLIGVVNTTPAEPAGKGKRKNGDEQGKDAKPAEPALTVDASFVRRIRPMLTGYYQCRDRKKPAPPTTTTPTAPADTPVVIT